MEDTTAYAKAQQKKTKYTVSFYNLENLFDIKDDPKTLDDDFTPEGWKEWNTYKYDKKLSKLSKVIAQIGKKETGTSPSLVGVAEVENLVVLKDLIATDALKDEGYAIVHYDSPDERGIDVALLYKKTDLNIIQSKPLTLYLEAVQGGRDFTRDILYIHGILTGIEVHIFVNHWPSRRSGSDETSAKRIAAAHRTRDEIDRILIDNPDARIIVMGDFNDGPQSKSVKTHLVKNEFYNPMLFLATKYEGSLNYNAEWFTFDQILFTNNFVRLFKNPLLYDKSDIFNDVFLTEYKGRYKGNPFRTYAGKKYLGGYSDHFPVYSILKRSSKN